MEEYEAVSLYSRAKKFDEYSNEIQELYKNTFGNSEVVKTWYDGKIKDTEFFEQVVTKHTLRCQKGYKFVGFIIKQNDTDKVVGYESLNDGNKDNTAEVAYLLAKEFQGGGIGSLACFTLVEYYGKSLYKDGALVNQVYDQNLGLFAGGTAFKKVAATVMTSNIGSAKVLEKSGLKKIPGEFQLYGDTRNLYERDYEAEEVSISGKDLLDSEQV